MSCGHRLLFVVVPSRRPHDRHRVVTSRRLHPWTRDQGTVAVILRRRCPEQLLWERVLLVAVDFDDLANDLAAAPEQVPRLTTMARDLLARLPEPHEPPGPVPLELLDAIHDTGAGARHRDALAACLAEAAERLARLAGAPGTRHAGTLKCEAAGILTGLAPLLSAWAEQIPNPALLPTHIAPSRADGCDNRDEGS